MTSDYSGHGNEKLVPLAEAGDDSALAELVKRGNYLDARYPGKACKDKVASSVLNDAEMMVMGVSAETIVTVVSGKVMKKS